MLTGLTENCSCHCTLDKWQWDWQDCRIWGQVRLMGILEGLQSNPLDYIAAKPEFCGCKCDFSPSWVLPLCMQSCAHWDIHLWYLSWVSCSSWPPPYVFQANYSVISHVSWPDFLACWLFLLAYNSFSGRFSFIVFIVLVRAWEKMYFTTGNCIFCQLLASLEPPLPSPGQLAAS